jgi:DNA-binding MarR family transcriptional regulator
MKQKPEGKLSPALPRAGEGKRGEKGHLGYLLRQAGAAVRGRIERALDDLGVTGPQFVVLTLVGAYPGLSNADLARLSHLTPQTVNVIVGNLRQSGAVTSRPHATHGRIQQLALTADGRDVLARCRPRVQSIEESLAAGLSAAEEKFLRRWLVWVAAGADGRE